MNCKNCGLQIQDTKIKICPHCGAGIIIAPEPQSAETPPYPATVIGEKAHVGLGVGLIICLVWYVMSSLLMPLIIARIFNAGATAYMVSLINIVLSLGGLLPLAIVMIVTGRMQATKNVQPNTDRLTGIGNIAFGIYLGVSILGSISIFSLFMSGARAYNPDQLISILFSIIRHVFCILAFIMFIRAAGMKKRLGQNHSSLLARIVMMAVYIVANQFILPLLAGIFLGIWQDLMYNYDWVTSIFYQISIIITYALVFVIVLVQAVGLFQNPKGGQAVSSVYGYPNQQYRSGPY